MFSLSQCIKVHETSDRGGFWAEPVEILVFASPTGQVLTSSGFPLLNWVYSINSSKMIGKLSCSPIIGQNRQLVTNEPVEFEK